MVPGIYAVGSPSASSPVLVTANYKLSFDTLRRELSGLDVWILVLDTRGINVWCAAGKELFSTEEVVSKVQSTRLAELVSHRELILPQLSATAVGAHKVRKGCGFKVRYGPVAAPDIPKFLATGQADEAMRSVTFTLKERAELIPVELYAMGKPLLIMILAAFVLSGIGPGIYDFGAAWSRGLAAITATITGILAGGAVVPLLLNRLPWKQFWPKGLLTGMLTGLLTAIVFKASLSIMGSLALILWSGAASSFLAMNFTGSTPYTSPTGVETEMKRGIPVQIVLSVLALGLWIATPFIV